MEIFRNLTVDLAITTLVACNDVTIEGSWVESVPGISNLKQGFTLEANGSASSINMATLKYEKWKKEGNLLLLSGISIGNHQSISFTDTLTVEQLTQDSLILKKGELVLRYSKTNEIPDEEAENFKTIGDIVEYIEAQYYIKGMSLTSLFLLSPFFKYIQHKFFYIYAINII